MENWVLHAPWCLWIWLLVPLWWFLAGRSSKPAAIAISSIALVGKGKEVATTSPSRWWRLLGSLVIFLIGLALARPQAKIGFTESKSSGIDIFIAIDISGSMTALDMTEGMDIKTRLDIAKRVTRGFIAQRSFDRLGMIAFAGEPFLLSPLTLNHLWLAESVDKMAVTKLPGGTAIGSAVAMSVSRLKELEAETRILILVTDGENNAGQISPEAATDLAKTFGVKIYTVGVGSGREARLPTLDDDGNVRYDRFGRPIMSRTIVAPVDEKSLREIAEQTGGRYFSAQSEEEFSKVFAEIDALEKTEVTLREEAIYEEKFMYPLTLAAGLWLFLMLNRCVRGEAYP